MVAEHFSVHYDTYFKVVKTLCAGMPTTAAAPPPTSFSRCSETWYSMARHRAHPHQALASARATPCRVVDETGIDDEIKIIDPKVVHVLASA